MNQSLYIDHRTGVRPVNDKGAEGSLYMKVHHLHCDQELVGPVESLQVLANCFSFLNHNALSRETFENIIKPVLEEEPP